MGVPVLVLGASGSGKSASLRNFEPDEIKPLIDIKKNSKRRKVLKKT